ncbi:MAG: hypothetical protein JSU67_00085 [Gammaproteobacteria bacterium]|nr:MAG: hypothetical protein JSU67_00085 [Gammaproteobacteria bacterium]
MLPDSRLQEIENRLVAARTRLILDKPFLGALALRLPLIAADASWCSGTHTDARSFFYNPEYIEKLQFEQVQFVLSAEAMHCALSHFNRRGHRDPARWELACEYAVNLILFDEGLTPPPEAMLFEDYRDMTAEEIYPLLEITQQEETQQTGDVGEQPAPPASGRRRDDASQASFDSGLADAPLPLGESEKDLLQQQWQQRLAGAAQQALQAGKMSEGMARLIELMLQPKLPWRAVLARFMNGIARDDYSYARPSSRRGDPAIFPSLRSAQIDVVVAVDVSGSIDREELDEFMVEIDALKAQVRARVTLLTCDSEITGDSPWIFEAWERCHTPPQVSGGGGTDFTPVFDWVDQRDRAPDLLIYFTDAEGRFPPNEPAYPSLWLVKGNGDIPWGQRIQLN